MIIFFYGFSHLDYGIKNNGVLLDLTHKGIPLETNAEVG